MKKAPLPQLEGEVDLCSLSGTLKTKAPDAVQALEIMGIPTKCPVEAVSPSNFAVKHKFKRKNYLEINLWWSG